MIEDSIRDHLSQDEALCQLAEECSELAHAALKLRRARTGINPTPICKRDAHTELIEEAGDVLSCLRVLLTEEDVERVKLNSGKKLERWAERLTRGC